VEVVWWLRVQTVSACWCTYKIPTFTQKLLHYTWCQRSVHYFRSLDRSKSL